MSHQLLGFPQRNYAMEHESFKNVFQLSDVTTVCSICGFRERILGTKEKSLERFGNSFIQCDNCPLMIHLSCIDVEESEILFLGGIFCPTCQQITGCELAERVMVSPHRLHPYNISETTLPVEVGSYHWLQNISQYLKPVNFRGSSLIIIKNKSQLEAMWRWDETIAMWEKPIVITKGSTLFEKMVTRKNFDLNIFFDFEKIFTVYEVYTQSFLLLPFRKIVENNSPNMVYDLFTNEISNDKRCQKFAVPKFFKKFSLVDQLDKKEEFKNMKKPNIQLFLNYSQTKSFTNFSIETGGSSVYLYIIYGMKTFWLAPPTTRNLKIYEYFTNEKTEWLAEKLEDVEFIIIREGQTLLIPSGFIYAVYTPVPTAYIKGNIFHLGSISTQIEIEKIERRLMETNSFNPFTLLQFRHLMWATAEKILCPKIQKIRIPINIEAKLCFKAADVLIETFTEWLKKERGQITLDSYQTPLKMEFYYHCQVWMKLVCTMDNAQQMLINSVERQESDTVVTSRSSLFSLNENERLVIATSPGGQSLKIETPRSVQRQSSFLLLEEELNRKDTMLNEACTLSFPHDCRCGPIMKPKVHRRIEELQEITEPHRIIPKNTYYNNHHITVDTESKAGVKPKNLPSTSNNISSDESFQQDQNEKYPLGYVVASTETEKEDAKLVNLLELKQADHDNSRIVRENSSCSQVCQCRNWRSKFDEVIFGKKKFSKIQLNYQKNKDLYHIPLAAQSEWVILSEDEKRGTRLMYLPMEYRALSDEEGILNQENASESNHKMHFCCF